MRIHFAVKAQQNEFTGKNRPNLLLLIFLTLKTEIKAAISTESIATAASLIIHYDIQR